MSFRYVPSQFRIPAVPYGFAVPDGYWCGEGTDKGVFAFQGASGWGNYVMTDGSFIPSLKVGSSSLSPVYSSVNGYVHWKGSGSVYYSLAYGWVYMPSTIFPGYDPVEDWESEEGETVWTGDDFYCFSSFPTGEDKTVALEGRGKSYGKTLEMSCTWKRWTSTREFGKYEAAGGASGEKFLGLPRFSGGGEYFVRSYAKTSGHYTYGRIRHVSSKWVIGEIGSDSGWHEGEEPSKEGSVTFRFCRNEGSEAKGSDIAVSLKDYVEGDETAASYLGEAAIWR